MRRWFLPILILMGLALPPIPLAAQDDARDRIAAAYEDAATWQTFQAKMEDTLSYVATAQGYNTLTWQRHNRALDLQATYDRSDDPEPIARLAIEARAATAIGNNNDTSETGWEIALDAAAVGGETFWQGTITTTPDDGFVLPDEWEPFGAEDAAQSPALAGLRLAEMLQPGTLNVDAEAWLQVAGSVEGPEMVNIDRRTRGELYTIEIALADLPEALPEPFWPLTGGESPIVAVDTLHNALLEDSILTWYVALDPSTGRLLLQTVEMRLSAELGPEEIAEDFRSLSVEASQSQTVVFSAVNEPLGEIDLPG